VGDRSIEASASGFLTASRDLFVGSFGATVDLKLEPLIGRLWGSDRYGTSVAISKASFAPWVPVVYVAVGTGFADALSVAPVGGIDGVPVLLTKKDSLPSVVAGELNRLNPDKIVVVGGTAAVSNVVIQKLGLYLP
jgi:putative cell wall-binding protein